MKQPTCNTYYMISTRNHATKAREPKQISYRGSSSRNKTNEKSQENNKENSLDLIEVTSRHLLLSLSLTPSVCSGESWERAWAHGYLYPEALEAAPGESMGCCMGPREGAGPSFGGSQWWKNRVGTRGWPEASTAHRTTSPNDSFGAVEDDDAEEQPLRICHRDTCPSLAQ